MTDPRTSVTASVLAEALREAGVSVAIVDDAPDVAASGATHDSRTVGAGDVFVCLRGESFDGHAFAEQAVAADAAMLLVDHQIAVPADRTVPPLVVADTRAAAGPLAAAVYGRPSARLTTVGVTGTNGKTTITEMLGAALSALGEHVERIGTLHGSRTTPEATELQARLARFVDDGATAAVMEVSSHALELHRVDGTTFDVVAFTNLGHDHLDLHGTQEVYFRAKSRLFDGSFGAIAVVNVDDVHGRLIADEAVARGDASLEVHRVSRDALTDVVVSAGEHRYRWRDVDVRVGIGGDFNVDNSHIVLEILAALGYAPASAAAALATKPTLGIPGRFETIDHEVASQLGFGVVVDYAHTPDGLEQLFTTARNIVGEGRLVGVYGCGGDRDRDKRPTMGRVGAERCDVAVFTSDNPRSEDPASIIDDMLAGVAEEYRRRVHPVVDRREAIDQALRTARSGDLVVIAGRGHEPVQDLGDHRIEFDDRVVARHLLSLMETPS